MRVCGIDVETTGLDIQKERITELGYVLWETDTNTPLLIRNVILKDQEVIDRTTPEIVNITGITADIIQEFGTSPRNALGSLRSDMLAYQPEYMVAHNGENFDRPLLQNEFERHGVPWMDTPWIDTRHDLPFDKEPDSHKLKYMAADMGFINPFPHRAVTDVLTMLKVMGQFDFGRVLAYSAIPWVVIRALVSFDDRQLAKDRRFSWEQVGGKKYEKCWVKRIKESQLPEEEKLAEFEIVQIKESE